MFCVWLPVRPRDFGFYFGKLLQIELTLIEGPQRDQPKLVTIQDFRKKCQEILIFREDSRFGTVVSLIVTQLLLEGIFLV